jgi:hypothetical protein
MSYDDRIPELTFFFGDDRIPKLTFFFCPPPKMYSAKKDDRIPELTFFFGWISFPLR